MASNTNTDMNAMSVVRRSQKGFHIGRSLSSPLWFSFWLHGSVVTVGVLTLKICSVESSTLALAKSGVTDDVNRSFDDINAAERGLARPIRCMDGWEDAETLLVREALESRPGRGDSPLLESRCSSKLKQLMTDTGE